MPEAEPSGFLVLPSGGQGRPVLVLHAWWGLNDTIKQLCRQLAAAGFIAYAPDLYDGRVADTIDGAETLAGAIFADPDRARADVTAAARYLSELAGSHGRSLAVLGFSLGAFFALDLSVSAPELVRSVVVFYGTRPGDYSSAQATYLGHFAAEDEFEPRSGVDDLEQALQRAGRPATFYRYDDTGHWFFEPDRAEAFDAAAANLAWVRTLDFLQASAVL